MSGFWVTAIIYREKGKFYQLEETVIVHTGLSGCCYTVVFGVVTADDDNVCVLIAFQDNETIFFSSSPFVT